MPPLWVVLVIRRLRHRWRFRTAQVTRLRAAVYAERCPRCHRACWDLQEALMIGDMRFQWAACMICGRRVLWLA